MGQKTAGTCYVKADGVALTVTGGCEAPVTEVVRETIVNGFFSEKDRTPYVKVDAVHTPGFPLDKLAKGENMTVTCEFKNGKTYVLSGAYIVGEPASAGDDGKISLEFHGIKGEWM